VTNGRSQDAGTHNRRGQFWKAVGRERHCDEQPDLTTSAALRRRADGCIIRKSRRWGGGDEKRRRRNGVVVDAACEHRDWITRSLGGSCRSLELNASGEALAAAAILITSGWGARGREHARTVHWKTARPSS
jgi:hypothetical protein